MPQQTEEHEFETLLRQWARSKASKANERDRALFTDFVEWCLIGGVENPGGADLADYLLERMDGGASLLEIQHIAAAVVWHYDAGGRFIDRRLVQGGLAMVEAQLTLNRTIN